MQSGADKYRGCWGRMINPAEDIFVGAFLIGNAILIDVVLRLTQN